MTEQRLALVGPELEARLLSRCKKLTSKVLCYRNWSDCLAAMADAAPAVVVGALPNDTAFDALWLQRLQQRSPLQLSARSPQPGPAQNPRHTQHTQQLSPPLSPPQAQSQPPLQAVNVPALVLLASAEQMDRALQLFQAGAYEYLATETDPEQIVVTVAQALQRARPASRYPERHGETVGALIGESHAVRELHRALQQLGKVRVPVLVRGEPGTGKQLFARSLHQQSGVSGPLVEVNVGALARAALDIELFGLERQQHGESQLVRSGRVEEADGGTLFLDEVAELPLDVQLRLAQLLADGHYHRVGGYGDCHASLRVIAATRYSLETLVRNGQFQPDLYHRLTVVQVQLPRLQERKEDIEPLVQHFLAQVAAEMAVAPKQLAPTVLPILEQYEWPGNIRQLENLCRRLAVMVTEPVIEASHLPLEMQPELQIANEARGWEDALRSWAEQSLAAGHRNLLDVAQPVLERILLQAALKQTGGLKQEAALLLGWGRNTLTRKLRELSIETDDDDEAA